MSRETPHGLERLAPRVTLRAGEDWYSSPTPRAYHSGAPGAERSVPPLLHNFMNRYQEFAAQIGRGQYAPQRRFLREMTWGLLKARTPVVANTARALKETKRLLYVEKRLLRNLVSERLDDDLLRTRLLELVAERIGDGLGVTLALDRGDINKSHARPDRPRGMEYAALIHDGSESTRDKPHIAMGYYYVAVQAVLPDGRRLPVWRELFSYTQPGHLSENHTTLTVLQKIAPYVAPGHVWLVADSGYDAAVNFRGLEDAGYRNWAIRVGRDRKVFDAQGNLLDIDVLAADIRIRYRSKSKVAGRTLEDIQFGLRTIHVKDDHGKREGVARSLVVYRTHRTDAGSTGVALILSRRVSHTEAEEAIHAYERRWAVVEAFEHEKRTDEYGFSLEDARVLSFLGLRRLLVLVMAACLFLSLIETEPLAKSVMNLVDTFKERETIYRLTRGVGEELLNRMDAERVRAVTRRWLRHG